MPAGAVTTIGYLAERLALRHHSVVELSDRCEEAGLIVRSRDPQNRRQVVLELTAAANRVLADLTADHARELTELGPQLIQALKGCIAP
ncbi:MAG: MarR family transcriptional regulator [Verrucomicrobiota bacterium]